MSRPQIDVEQCQTSWTFAEESQRMTCTLMGSRATEYILTVTHEGRSLLIERCQSPREALTRSLDAFRALRASGWLL